MHQDIVFPCFSHYLCKEGEAFDAYEKYTRFGACHTHLLLRETPSGARFVCNLFRSNVLTKFTERTGGSTS